MSKLLIGGKWEAGPTVEALYDRYRGHQIGEMAVATPADVTRAVTHATEAFAAIRLSPTERYEILLKAAGLIAERRPELLALITAETGFPRGDSESEVRRCVQTLRLSADEARRIAGEVVPLDATPGLGNRVGFTVLVPRGVVCAITPYNAPLNGVAHKVAPALAAGNAVIVKPSEYTPLTAVALCRALLDAGLPPGLLSLLHGPGASIGPALLADQRIAFYSFTGSTRVGKEIQRAAGLRGTQLELGSISSTIVCADADLALASSKIVAAGFRKAGQVCTSVQRVLVHRSCAAEFTELLVEKTKRLKVGDPTIDGTDVGPMISEAQAMRVEQWVAEAVREGAEVLTGGRRDGAVFQPTILRNVRRTMRVCTEEIFGPVVSVVEFDDVEAAYEEANGTPFGLAVGVFTKDVSIAMNAVRKLKFGGVHINETSSSRVDVMPFGGVKDSGHGREGPRYAVREMLEERLLTIAW
ncbi:MAG TPA: aldehyde dehydrogenase family protein [Thermodesulfobacteriota bacterium]